MAVGPLTQIAITKRDLPAAVAFYRDVLGLPFLVEVPGGTGPMVFFDLGHGVRLMMTSPAAAEFDHPASVLYLGVADIMGEEARLRGRGVTFDRGAHVVATMGGTAIWMAFLRDPDGHLIGITEQRPA